MNARRQLLLAGALGLGAAGLQLGRASARGALGTALGTDAPLWGLSAAGLAHGAESAVPPLWPTLLSFALRAGQDLVPAGQALSLLCAAALPALAFLFALGAGARAGPALALGLGLLLLPELSAWAPALDANGATALGLLASTGLLALALARPERPALAAAAALVAGLQPLLRESGLIIAGGALLLMPLLLPRGWRWSLLLVGTWWLSPLLVGSLPGASPLDVPWASRGGIALSDLATGAGPLPNYVGEIPPAERGPYVSWLRAGALHKVAAFHALRSFRLAWDGWLLALAALVLALPGLRRRAPTTAVLLPLLTLAPALLLWTQRRHVLLAAPALLLVLALGLAPAATTSPRVLRALAFALLLGSCTAWPARHRLTWEEHGGEVRRAQGLRELAAQVAESGATLLGGPIQDVGLYHPLPRHEPDGSVADAWTALVLPERQAGRYTGQGWAPVGRVVAELVVLRRPEGAQACPGGTPVLGSPYLSAGPVQARLLGCADP